MAAEIAGALAVGGSCPVCGSCDHPHKAVARPTALPTRPPRRPPQKAADDAAATERLPRRRGARPAPLGSPAATERIDVGAAAEIAAETGAGRPPPSTALAAEADARSTRGARPTTTEDAPRRASHARPSATPAPRSPRSTALASRARPRVAEAEAGARPWPPRRGRGFGAADEARRRRPRPRGRTTTLAARRRRRTSGGCAAVAAVLAEPGADEVAASRAPDLPASAPTHDEALRRARRRPRPRAACGDPARAARHALVADLDAAARRLGARCATTSSSPPGCPRSSRASRADNRLQMRLSAYVLAYRLSQVVAAANERLDRMSDQRYSLEHTGQRGAGETRGGLSLLVRDDWSGESRDPATLSGGETFVVSLALALGLADVVTHEAGGADLDTLFVDEGFGALDADTLDDVMDTLDSLRDGGRVVGVVSHVAEMRDRIPTQLRSPSPGTARRSRSAVSARRRRRGRVDVSPVSFVFRSSARGPAPGCPRLAARASRDSARSGRRVRPGSHASAKVVHELGAAWPWSSDDARPGRTPPTQESRAENVSDTRGSAWIARGVRRVARRDEPQLRRTRSTSCAGHRHAARTVRDRTVVSIAIGMSSIRLEPASSVVRCPSCGGRYPA